MIRSIFFASFFALSASALAVPGDLQDSVRDRIAQGARSCGLQIWSGRDPRLPWAIRNRIVDDVVVRVFANGGFAPGVLIDKKIKDSRDEEMSLTYMNVNGAHLLQLNRDFLWDDLSVWAVDQGTRAYSQTQQSAGGPVTRFYIRQLSFVHEWPQTKTQLVSEPEFTRFVNEELADRFVAWMCDFK